MLDALKRLISRHPPVAEWTALAQWARDHKMSFKRVRDEEGFVIDGGLASKPWRLEWGPPQRQYIEGQELRLRMDVGLSPDLQMLVLSQNLFETLESSTFDSFTETTQTVMDNNTPEEMRWLVMFPQATCKVSKVVRAHFHLVGSSPLEAANWFEGELAQRLESATSGFLKDEPPFMLMVLRGRVYLRLQLSRPDVASVSQAVAVFETAVLQAIRMGSVASDAPGWHHSDAQTAWQNQLGPEDPTDGPGPH